MANWFFTHLLSEFGTQFVISAPLRVNGNSDEMPIERHRKDVTPTTEMGCDQWPWSIGRPQPLGKLFHMGWLGGLGR